MPSSANAKNPVPDTTIVCLGRNGDILNMLPLAHRLAQTGKVRWMVGTECAPMLDGISYAEQVAWPGNCNETLPQAIAHARKLRLPNIIVPQACRNPDARRLTPSYQTEEWRLAGVPDDFGTLPLVIDRRDAAREKALAHEWIPHTGRKVALVASVGFSGPFPDAFRLIAAIRALDCEVVDLSLVKAERPFDLLGLMDSAHLLVTVDTMHMHLAKASRCPVIALTRDGWLGSSTPPPQTVRHFRYADAGLDAVAGAAKAALESNPGSVVVVSDVFGQTKRHLRARAKWPKNVIAKKHWGRDARSIGDARPLPYLKDLLQAGLDSGAECIVWTNDDTAFSKGALEAMARHVAVFGFGCVRRDAGHVGREAFFFSTGWLRENISAMPDPFIVVPKADLIMARWLRSLRGISTTRDNLLVDFFPVELPPGLVAHEDHVSGWLDSTKTPASLHNERLWNNYP